MSDAPTAGRRRGADEAPLSEFIAKMRDVFRRRLEAVDGREKRAVEREMEAIMRTYLGRSAWDASAAAEEHDVVAGVPRDTPRRRRGHGPSKYSGDVDHKLAAAGPDHD